MERRIRTYSMLSTFDTFEERFEYLRLNGVVGRETFGFDRYINQQLYTSPRWRSIRDHIILRDGGFDLGIQGCDIAGRLLIHHMNPINIDDIRHNSSLVFEPEYLICTSHRTHNAIHFGTLKNEPGVVLERKPGDTCPWL